MKKAQLCLGVACVTAGCFLLISEYVSRHRRSAQFEVSDWQEIPSCPAGTIVGDRNHSAKLWFDGKDWKVVAGTCADILELRLKVTPALPPADGAIEPIVSTGVKGRANLVCLVSHGNGEYQVGADIWGLEMKSGKRFRSSERGFFLDLVIDRVNNCIRAAKDDEVIYETRLKPWPVANMIWFLGSNPFGGSFVASKFSGEVGLAPGARSADSGGARAGSLPDSWLLAGSVFLKVSFGRSGFEHGQPLLALGSAGKADLFYARLDDQTHLSFGFDHWGVGGTVGPPVEFDPNFTHVVVIKCEGMPAVGGVRPQTGRAYRVTLDGKEVLKGEASFYPATIQQVYLGANPLGGSTADAVFSGEIIAKGISL